MKKQFLQSAKVIILGLILVVGVSYAIAWTNPPSLVAGNVPAPINIHPAGQWKAGGLAIVVGNFSVDTLLSNPLFKVTQGSPNKITIGDAYMSGSFGGGGTTKISLFSISTPPATPTRLCITSTAQLVLCP